MERRMADNITEKQVTPLKHTVVDRFLERFGRGVKTKAVLGVFAATTALATAKPVEASQAKSVSRSFEVNDGINIILPTKENQDVQKQEAMGIHAWNFSEKVSKAWDEVKRKDIKANVNEVIIKAGKKELPKDDPGYALFDAITGDDQMKVIVAETNTMVQAGIEAFPTLQQRSKDKATIGEFGTFVSFKPNKDGGISAAAMVRHYEKKADGGLTPDYVFFNPEGSDSVIPFAVKTLMDKGFSVGLSIKDDKFVLTTWDLMGNKFYLSTPDEKGMMTLILVDPKEASAVQTPEPVEVSNLAKRSESTAFSVETYRYQPGDKVELKPTGRKSDSASESYKMVITRDGKNYYVPLVDMKKGNTLIPLRVEKQNTFSSPDGKGESVKVTPYLFDIAYLDRSMENDIRNIGGQDVEFVSFLGVVSSQNGKDSMTIRFEVPKQFAIGFTKDGMQYRGDVPVLEAFSYFDKYNVHVGREIGIISFAYIETSGSRDLRLNFIKGLGYTNDQAEALYDYIYTSPSNSQNLSEILKWWKSGDSKQRPAGDEDGIPGVLIGQLEFTPVAGQVIATSN